MGNSEEEDYIEELTASFETAIAEGTTDSFDLDELLEVYDYASDTGNEYVKFHALMCGLKNWGDELEIKERLAYYFYEKDDTGNGTGKVLEQLPADNRIRTILSAVHYGVDKRKAQRVMESMLHEAKNGVKLTDEEVIRMIELTCTQDWLGWYEENYDILKDAAEFPDTVMNELGEKLREFDADYFRHRVLEDFVNEYPLLYSAWQQFAEYQIFVKRDWHTGQYAVDNALAINPSLDELRLDLMDLMMETDAGMEAVFEEYRKIDTSKSTEHPRIVTYKSLYHESKGDSVGAERTLWDGLAIHPFSSEIISRLVLLRGGDLSSREIEKIASGYISLLFVNHPEILSNEIAKMTGMKEYRSALTMMRVVRRIAENAGYKAYRDEEFAQWLYKVGNYGEIIETFKDYVNRTDFIDDVMSLLYALSLKMTGKTELLREFLNEEFAKRGIMEAGSIQDLLQSEGTAYYLRRIGESLDDDTLPRRVYDPFFEL